MKTITVFFAIVLTVIAGTASTAAAGHVSRVHGLSFSTTLEFSLPGKAGLDAVCSVFPKDAKPGAESMSITAVRFPAEAVGAGGMSDAELLDYVKTAFLAATGAGRPVERTFLSQKVKGEAFAKTIPVPAQAEIYVIALTDGAKVVLGFAFAPKFAAQAGLAIGEVAASLKE